METEFMTTKEVAEYLNLSVETIREIAKRKILKPMKLGHNIRRYRKSEVDAMVKTLSERED